MCDCTNCPISFFFFSSRRRHTRFKCDWSSDVCSSDSEAARLLEADRASIFIWDRDHHEVVACPAMGIEGNMLRLPDNTGIVGECLHTGKAIVVDDAYRDARFNRDVDAKSGYKTHTLLCVPLVDARGERIGAFETINKRQGSFTGD